MVYFTRVSCFLLCLFDAALDTQRDTFTDHHPGYHEISIVSFVGNLQSGHRYRGENYEYRDPDNLQNFLFSEG